MRFAYVVLVVLPFLSGCASRPVVQNQAECFGATGLSGQCVVLWRAELGRVPIEAATCKGQDAHTCRPTPGLSCHEGDTRGAWPPSSSLLAASRALACARLIISPCFQTLSVGRVAVTTPSPDPDL